MVCPCKEKYPGKWWAVKIVGDEMIITKKKRGRRGIVDFSQSQQSLSSSSVPLCIQISDANGVSSFMTFPKPIQLQIYKM